MAQEHKDREYITTWGEYSEEVFICERCGPFDDDLTTYDFSITAQIRGADLSKVILVFECCGCGWATGQVEVKDFSFQSEYITTRPAGNYSNRWPRHEFKRRNWSRGIPDALKKKEVE